MTVCVYDNFRKYSAASRVSFRKRTVLLLTGGTDQIGSFSQTVKARFQLKLNSDRHQSFTAGSLTQGTTFDTLIIKIGSQISISRSTCGARIKTANKVRKLPFDAQSTQIVGMIQLLYFSKVRPFLDFQGCSRAIVSHRETREANKP